MIPADQLYGAAFAFILLAFVLAIAVEERLPWVSLCIAGIMSLPTIIILEVICTKF